MKTLKLRKIISGGQTGADQGGLGAGRTAGLETGGTAPPGFQTGRGKEPKLLHDVYGLVEGPPDPKLYPIRTRMNVRDSDGTLWMGNTDSPGGKLTLRTVEQMKKPFIINPDPQELFEWLRDEEVEVLNVAGNREHTNPGIGYKTMRLIMAMLIGGESKDE